MELAGGSIKVSAIDPYHCWEMGWVKQWAIINWWPNSCVYEGTKPDGETLQRKTNAWPRKRMCPNTSYPIVHHAPPSCWLSIGQNTHPLLEAQLNPNFQSMDCLTHVQENPIIREKKHGFRWGCSQENQAIDVWFNSREFENIIQISSISPDVSRKSPEFSRKKTEISWFFRLSPDFSGKNPPFWSPQNSSASLRGRLLHGDGQVHHGMFAVLVHLRRRKGGGVLDWILCYDLSI